MARRHTDESGIALAAVLWIMLPLAAVLAISQRLIQADLSAIDASRRALEREAAVYGALEIAGYKLSQTPAGRQLNENIRIGRLAVTVKTTSEATRVDLNLADETIISGIVRQVIEDRRHANRIAARILDWRDEDDDVRPDGAEAANYDRERRSGNPRNGPFRDITELNTVLGLTALDFAALAPHVTVSSQDGKIDIQRASETVLRAIPDLSDGEIEQLRGDASAFRESATAFASGQTPRRGSANGPTSRDGGIEALSQFANDDGSSAFRVTVAKQDTAEVLATAVVMTGFNQTRPHRILSLWWPSPTGRLPSSDRSQPTPNEPPRLGIARGQ